MSLWFSWLVVSRVWVLRPWSSSRVWQFVFCSSFLPLTFPGICAPVLPYFFLFSTAGARLDAARCCFNSQQIRKSGNLYFPHKTQFYQIMSPSKPVVGFCHFLSDGRHADERPYSRLETDTLWPANDTCFFHSRQVKISNKTDKLQLQTSWKHPADSVD